MSLTWKIVLPLVVLVIGAGAVVKFKNNFVVPSVETSGIKQKMVGEKRSYDQNSPDLTEAEIGALVQAASAEPAMEAEEERDAVLVTSDNQALNNFNNASYESANF